MSTYYTNYLKKENLFNQLKEINALSHINELPSYERLDENNNKYTVTPITAVLDLRIFNDPKWTDEYNERVEKGVLSCRKTKELCDSEIIGFAACKQMIEKYGTTKYVSKTDSLSTQFTRIDEQVRNNEISIKMLKKIYCSDIPVYEKTDNEHFMRRDLADFEKTEQNKISVTFYENGNAMEWYRINRPVEDAPAYYISRYFKDAIFEFVSDIECEIISDVKIQNGAIISEQ